MSNIKKYAILLSQWKKSHFYYFLKVDSLTFKQLKSNAKGVFPSSNSILVNLNNTEILVLIRKK